jgi:hypothetical protein
MKGPATAKELISVISKTQLLPAFHSISATFRRSVQTALIGTAKVAAIFGQTKQSIQCDIFTRPAKH